MEKLYRNGEMEKLYRNGEMEKWKKNDPMPGNSSAANNTGAVAIPSRKSPSVGFPSTDPVPTKSNTSSWN